MPKDHFTVNIVITEVTFENKRNPIGEHSQRDTTEILKVAVRASTKDEALAKAHRLLATEDKDA